MPPPPPPKENQISVRSLRFSGSRQFRVEVTYYSSRLPEVTGNWNVSRGEMIGIEKFKDKIEPNTIIYDPMKYTIQTGDFMNESFSATLFFPGTGETRCTIAYRISPKLRLPADNFNSEFFIFVSWGTEKTGYIPPPQDPTRFEFSFNPIKHVKALGKSFVQVFTSSPPQYSALIVQRVLISALEGVPEFELRCTFELADITTHPTAGSDILRGFLAFHCGTTSFMLTPLEL